MDNTQFLKYKTPSVIISHNSRYRADCGTIVFKNEGNTIVTIDNHWTLPPGSSFSIDAPPVGSTFANGEMHWIVQYNIHEYQVNFGSGTISKLVIISQVYQ